MQVTRATLFQHFEHITEDGVHCLVLDVREDTFLKLNAPDLEPVLVRTLEFLAWIGGSVLMTDRQGCHSLLQSLSFPLEGLFVLFAKFKFDLTGLGAKNEQRVSQIFAILDLETISFADVRLRKEMLRDRDAGFGLLRDARSS